jgi:hypothetical protein
VLLNYPGRLKVYAGERDELEEKFMRGAMGLSGAPAAQRAEFSNQCFQEAARSAEDWLKRVEQIPARRKFWHARAWDGFNKKAGMTGIR